MGTVHRNKQTLFMTDNPSNSVFVQKTKDQNKKPGFEAFPHSIANRQNEQKKKA